MYNISLWWMVDGRSWVGWLVFHYSISKSKENCFMVWLWFFFLWMFVLFFTVDGIEKKKKKTMDKGREYEREKGNEKKNE